MPKLTEITTYDDVMHSFSWDSLWALFDGDRDCMNLAHECIDRHRAQGIAISVKFADGHSEHYDYAVLADLSGRFANWLTTMGIAKGDRVAIVLDPGKAFYVSLFGTIKRGAIAVPLFTLFGPEGLALRINDCQPRLILTQQRAEALSAQFPGATVVEVNDAFWAALHAASPAYTPDTRAADLAVFQYTSGTTRELPEAVKHTHRSVVTLMIAALYGVGLRPGDRYFCPSSPAWGHGLWHGTMAPLALGIHIASYAGKFEAGRMFEALAEFQITNMAAAPTVFRLLKNSGLHDRYRLHLEKISFTGEPMDPDTFTYIERALGVTPCSMYGTTEVGVLDTQALKSVNFLLILFVGGSLSMAKVLTETHVLDTFITPLLHWQAPLLSTALRASLTLYWGGFLYHFLAGSEITMVSTLLPVLLRVADVQGYNPAAVGMLWTFAGGGKLFVYQSSVFVLGYSYGFFTAKDLFKVGAILTLVQGFFPADPGAGLLAARWYTLENHPTATGSGVLQVRRAHVRGEVAR